MSNPFKAIGRVFKKVIKTVKKIALPALAIGAVVLTGGAALGLLPVLGAGGLGLSAGLSAIVAGAGYGGLAGGLTAAISGKNILKGVTSGAIIGGATGGIAQGLGVGMNLPGMAAKQGASVATSGASSAVTGLGSTLPASTSLPLSGSTLSSITAGAAKEAVGAVPSLISSAAPKAITGLGSFLSSQPYVVPSIIQGVGGALSSGAEAKAERDYADEIYKRRQANYTTVGLFNSPPVGLGAGMTQQMPQQQPKIGRWRIDPVSGQPFRDINA